MYWRNEWLKLFLKLCVKFLSSATLEFRVRSPCKGWKPKFYLSLNLNFGYDLKVIAIQVGITSLLYQFKFQWVRKFFQVQSVFLSNPKKVQYQTPQNWWPAAFPFTWCNTWTRHVGSHFRVLHVRKWSLLAGVTSLDCVRGWGRWQPIEDQQFARMRVTVALGEYYHDDSLIITLRSYLMNTLLLCQVIPQIRCKGIDRGKSSTWKHVF